MSVKWHATLWDARLTADELRSACLQACREGLRAVWAHPAWCETAARAVADAVADPSFEVPPPDCETGGTTAADDDAEATNRTPLLGALVGGADGVTLSAVKVYETELAAACGARLIDLRLNPGWLRDRNWPALLNEIEAVVTTATPYDASVLLGVPFDLLDDELLDELIGFAIDLHSEGIILLTDQTPLEWARVSPQWITRIAASGLHVVLDRPRHYAATHLEAWTEVHNLPLAAARTPRPDPQEI